MSDAHLYRAFGRALQSDVRLPELARQREGPPDLILRTIRAPAPGRIRLAAEHRVAGQSLRVWETGRGLLFDYEPVGAFEIERGGREIRWFPAAGAVPEYVRAAILGPVLALALHELSVPCLHGSAVKIGADGVAFIAPKGHGKSTLAAALVEAGAQLITDDTVAVALDPAPLLLPGVHSVKLWGDSLGQLAPSLPRSVGAGAKSTLRGFPARVRRSRPTPFTAAYVLIPRPADAAATLTREPLAPRAAALALVANAKLGHLLEPPQTELLLRTAAALARRVPVYALVVPRHWEQLPKVVATLLSWHGSRNAVGANGGGHP